MNEKRRFMRFNVLLNAICRSGDTSKEIHVNDFSREGLSFTTEEDLPKGGDIELELAIPGDNIPVIVSGQIAWTTKLPDDGTRYKSGVKLTEVRTTDRGRILNYIYKKWMAPAGN